jgi:hypothetical protein
MIGKQTLIIDMQELASRGMSSGANIADGAFSNETDAVNITAVPGVLYAPAIAVDSDTDVRLTGNPIASCPDMNTVGATNRLVVTDDGKAYRYNGTKLDSAGISLTTSKTWSAGFTDILTFGGETYVSSKESLTRWQNDNTIDAGASWPFNFTNSNVPHPGIVYENNMYWADKNLLLTQSTVGDAVAPTTILTLDTSSIILSLGVDPGSGLMLIGTTNTLDTSGTLPAVNKLLWYDGNSTKVTKSVIVEDSIFGFHTVGGTTFVGYGKNLGYMNGSGISFLRKLKNVTNVQAELPYKHHFSHIGNTLYVLDGLQILAYGEVLTGRKVFYYCFKNNVNSNKPTMLGYGGNGKLVFGFASSKFYSFDTTSVSSTNTMTFYTNKYNFPRPVFLRSVYLEYATALTAGDNNRSINYQSEDLQTGFQILRVQGQTGTSGIKNESSSSVYFIDNVIGFLNNKVRSLQLRYLTDTANSGIKRIIVYYDPAE